jgi:site-specific recombinase XerD
VGVSELVDSWEIALRAERKSKNTLASYLLGVRLYLRWAADKDLPDEIDRRAVQAWIGDLLEDGAEASTARARQLAVRRFSVWLLDEGEITTDPLAGLRTPKIDTKVVEPMTEEELQALLKTCDRSFLGIRDEAIIRLMSETIIRAGEVVAMDLDDLNVKAGTAIVRRGKGGKGRMVGYGAKTAAALDRYLRARRQHKHATSPKLWLGQQGDGFGYRALHKALGQRAKAAGIANFHPHLTRHTGATRWLAAGGSEGGLMAVAGWSQRSMLDRYTKATASERAAVEARKLDLGDL